MGENKQLTYFWLHGYLKPIEILLLGSNHGAQA